MSLIYLQHIHISICCLLIFHSILNGLSHFWQSCVQSSKPLLYSFCQMTLFQKLLSFPDICTHHSLISSLRCKKYPCKCLSLHFVNVCSMFWILAPSMTHFQSCIFLVHVFFIFHLSLYTISFISDFYINTLVAYFLKTKQKHFLGPIFPFLK